MMKNMFFLFALMMVNIINVISSEQGATFFKFGVRTKYSEHEDGHICIDNFYESCNRDSLKEILTGTLLKQSSHSVILQSLEIIEQNRQMCLIDTDLRINECYDKLYDDISKYIIETSDVTQFNNLGVKFKHRLKHCKTEMNKSCRTSSFVIDSIRSCTNDAISGFYKEIYSNIPGGAAAKNDVNAALVSLQQYTIETKDNIVGGLEYIRKLDLLMDRLTFCSSQINQLEAVGI
jgi:hypothetical protein